MKKKVILVHGFNKNQKDMLILKKNLEQIGYECILMDLPLTFKEIEYCTSVFEEKIKEIICSLKEDEKINLVGHSTGGLIIRQFLSNTEYIYRIYIYIQNIYICRCSVVVNCYLFFVYYCCFVLVVVLYFVS